MFNLALELSSFSMSAPEAREAAPVQATTGAARRARERHRRSLARKVLWITGLCQDSKSHHTGGGGGDSSCFQQLCARVTALEAAILAANSDFVAHTDFVADTEMVVNTDLVADADLASTDMVTNPNLVNTGMAADNTEMVVNTDMVTNLDLVTNTGIAANAFLAANADMHTNLVADTELEVPANSWGVGGPLPAGRGIPGSTTSSTMRSSPRQSPIIIQMIAVRSRPR